ncbi:hypothetical protein J9317_04190 [Metabacillus sp. KIGAM252]|uniref:Uncharacterized protein n=1 Tax=Metabacillus flavus TaxID=2823519 RepID=A0ABS5LB77_9BACI|nr:hypothetical protein [Metabacillus flavus]MBS2967975.1 hypothetical protein [Metabacillus flavus]
MNILWRVPVPTCFNATGDGDYDALTLSYQAIKEQVPELSFCRETGDWHRASPLNLHRSGG